MTNYVVSAGSPVSNITLNTGDTMTVLSGGVATGIDIVGTAALSVSSGGSAVNAVVNPTRLVIAGTLTVYSGGVTIGTLLEGWQVDGGGQGVEVISSGASAIDTSVDYAGLLTIAAGASATGTNIAANGVENVLSGGVENVPTVAGTEEVFGVASGATLIGGAQNVFSGGLATATTASSSATQIVAAGGSAINTTLSNSYEVVAGRVISITLDGRSLETVSSGGVAVSTTVNSGATFLALSNGVLSDSTVNSGGTQDIYFGGSAVSTTSSPGATLYSAAYTMVASGATSSGLTFGPTGVIVALSGGTISNIVLGSGATEYVSGGGQSLGTVVSGGGTAFDYGTDREVVLIGAPYPASETVLLAYETVISGGLAVGAMVSGGGILTVGINGVASSTLVNGTNPPGVQGGGEVLVDSGGVTFSDTLISGGWEQVVGGIAHNVTVSAGAEEIVGAGVALATFVSSGGGLLVNGGSAVSATIGSGGNLAVGIADLGNGTAVSIDAVLSSGATETVTGGTSIDTVVSSGASITVSFNIVTASGIFDGYTSATVIQSGGALFVGVLGSSLNDVLEFGGSAVIGGAGSVDGMAVSGVLLLSGGLGSGNTIFSGGSALVSGGFVSVTTISRGGVEYIYSGSIAEATAISIGGIEIISSGATAIDPNILGGTEYVATGGTVSGASPYVSGHYVATPGYVNFDNVAGGVLVIAAPTTSATAFGATISGLTQGDVIDLTGLAYPGSGLISVGAGNVLSVTEAGQNFSQQLDPTQNFSSDSFSLGAATISGGAATAISVLPVGFHPGPAISGLPASQSTSGVAGVAVFSAVTVSDPNNGATDSLTIVVSGGGTLSGAGLMSAGGVYIVSGTAAAVTSVLDGVVFTPPAGAANTSQTTSFTLTDSSTALSNPASAGGVVIDVGAGATTISGTFLSPQLVTDGQSFAAFANVVISDPNPAAAETATITLTSGGTPTDANGTLTGSGLTKAGTGTYTLTAGSAAGEQAALRALLFTPGLSNQGAIGSLSTGLTLQVSDGVASAATDSNTVIDTLLESQPLSLIYSGGAVIASISRTGETSYVTTPVDDVTSATITTITGLLNGSQLVQQSFNLPFSDPTVQAAVARIDGLLTTDGAVPGAPALTSSQVTDQNTQTTTMVTGQQVSAPIQTFFTVFGPANPLPTVTDVNGVPNSSFMVATGTIDTNINFDYQVAIAQTVTTTGTQLTTQQYVISGLTTDAYSITGTQAAQPTTDLASINPFAAVSVVNPVSGAYGTATVSLSSAVNGVLSNPGIGTLGHNGTSYTVSGTAADIQSALRALVFTPVAHEVAVGGSVTTGFTLSVADNAGSATNSTTSVVATAADTPPTITDTSASQIPVVSATIQPFAYTTIADPDAGATESTTITLTLAGTPSDAAGTLSGTGLTKTGVGTYALATATVAAENTDLQGLVFTPTALHEQTSLGVTLAVSDGIAAPVTAMSTLGLAANPGGPVAPTDSNQIVTVYIDTPVSSATHDYATRIEAVLNGATVVYDQSFNLPYSDPTVQAAVAQADAALSNAGASPGSPVQTASNLTTVSSQTSYVSTGSSGTAAQTTTVTFGPGELGPAVNLPNSDGDNSQGYFDLYVGQEDININTASTLTISRTVTTSSTDLLTQQYVIGSVSSVGGNPGPVISGLPASQSLSGGAGVAVFAGFTVTDPNGGATDSLTIVVSGGGTLSGAGLISAGGVYGLSGTAAAVTSTLDGLVFTPGSGGPNSSSTTSFTLTDSSSVSSTAATASTVVTDQYAAVAPAISGVVASQGAGSGGSLRPFAAATISDANVGGSDTLTIMVSGGGTLSAVGLTSAGGGVYTASGSAAAVTSVLEAALFTPPPSGANTSQTTSFSLTDSSTATSSVASAGGVVTDIIAAVAPADQWACSPARR